MYFYIDFQCGLITSLQTPDPLEQVSISTSNDLVNQVSESPLHRCKILGPDPKPENQHKPNVHEFIFKTRDPIQKSPKDPHQKEQSVLYTRKTDHRKTQHFNGGTQLTLK